MHFHRHSTDLLVPPFTVASSASIAAQATTDVASEVHVAVPSQPFRPPAKRLAVESPDDWKSVAASPSAPLLLLPSSDGLTNTVTSSTACAISVTEIKTPAPKPPRFRLQKKAQTPFSFTPSDQCDSTSSVYSPAASNLDASVHASVTSGSLTSKQNKSSIARQDRPTSSRFNLPPRVPSSPPATSPPTTAQLTDDEYPDDGPVPMRWTAAEDAELRKLRDDNVRCIFLSCLLKFYVWFLFVKISVRSLSTVGLRGMFWWQCSIAIKKRTNSEPNVPSRRDGENCKRRSSTTLRNISPLGLYLK